MNKYEVISIKLLNEYGISIKTVRKSMSGVAYIEDRVISCPAPKSPLSFAIFAHEVGHIANGSIKPRWLEELKAWQFSIACFKKFGLSIPREVRQRMKYSLSFALAKALNRDMKRTPPELRAYRKYLSPITYIYGNGTKRERWHADFWKVKNL